MGARLLEAVGEQQVTGPVAILIDDLQWADRKSVEALTFTLRRLSVNPVIAIMIYRGASDRLDEAAQRMLVSVENRLLVPLGGLGPDEVASLAAALTAGSLDDQAVQWLYRGTGGHPLYLRTVLSEGFDFDPRAPGRLALPRSLTEAIGDHLRVLPAETRVILEMLSVLNMRLPLAQLSRVVEVDSPGTAIEQAVASGLVDWSPEEPTCPVEIRHPMVRDAIYAGIAAARRRTLHALAASMVSESASWKHRVAALDRPDERLAGELEQLAGEEAADGRLALAATHLQWASRTSTRPGPTRGAAALRCGATWHSPRRSCWAWPCTEEVVGGAVPLRSCALGTMAFSSGQLAQAQLLFSEALTQARDDPRNQPLAAVIASRLAIVCALVGDAEKVQALGRWALGTGCLDAAAASITRTVIAVGASQMAGPRAALAKLGHLDADPARVGLVDVDGLSFRGVFRATRRRSGPGHQRPGRQPQDGTPAARPPLATAAASLPGAGPVPGRRVGRRAAHHGAGILRRRDSFPHLRPAAAAPGGRVHCRPGGARSRRPNGTRRSPRRRRPAWITARKRYTRRWPGPWCARRRATT